jgi:hypothetical protein
MDTPCCVLRDWRGARNTRGRLAEVVDRGIGFGRVCVIWDEIKDRETHSRSFGAAGAAGLAGSDAERAKWADLTKWILVSR